MPCRELRFVLSVVFYVVSENPQNRIGSKSCRNQKKTPENPKISGVVLELLTRFELVTSSLPTTVEPSSPCCIRLCGVFCPKRMRSQPVCSIVSVRSFPRVGQRVGQGPLPYTEFFQIIASSSAEYDWKVNRRPAIFCATVDNMK